MSSGLEKLELLELARDAILLCEWTAMCHDIGKLSYEFVAWASEPRPPETSGFHHARAVRDVPGFVDPSFLAVLRSQRLERLLSGALAFVPVEARIDSLLDLVCEHHSPRTGLWLVDLLRRCDGLDSGADKVMPPGGTGRVAGKQPLETTFRATAFGAEPRANRIDPQALSRKRAELIARILPHLEEVERGEVSMGEVYKELLYAVRVHFGESLGETRRSANDVLLSDHAHSVGSLYKAALARCVLESVALPPEAIEWRLLRVTFNGLAFLQRAADVGDLLARQEALNEALDRVRDLLEVEYPLGNEVYRDENGSAFLVPVLDDDRSGARLLRLLDPPVRAAFRQASLQGDVRPAVTVSEPWREAREVGELLHEAGGQGGELPGVARAGRRLGQPSLLSGRCQTSAFPDAVQHWWRDEIADVCALCGLRPRGLGARSELQRREAVGRESCWVCLERRARRSADWLDDEGAAWRRTIWLDEAADRHGRLALVVGRFDLRSWLDGAMVGTMLARAGSACVPKNPSFARLQRVWKTTKGFWRSIDMDELPKMLPSDRRRLIITPRSRSELGLEANHVYDAEVRDVRTAVVWDARRGALVTADDLGRLASRLGAQKSIADDQVEAGRHVARLIDELRLYRPGGYGQQRLPLTALTVAPGDVCLSDRSYSPFIPLLAEPSTYMCIVPADHALQVVAMIRGRYVEEMGKVRNRLPLFAGVVFFDRRHPLSAVLDAGRRMLNLDLVETEWVLERPPEVAGGECILSFEDGAQWRVPVKMGDGTTPDEWYPYYRVKADAHGQPPMGRRQFVRDLSTGECWVHVEDLQPGDRVTVAPARFSYLHLDSSARRFEVPRLRRWLLEDVDEMIGLWQKLEMLAGAGRLTDSRLRAVWSLVQAKRDGWWLDEPPASDAPPEEAAEYRARRGAFEKLVSAALQVEGIGDGVVRPEQVQSGLLQATLEIHLDVMKKRLASARQSSLEVEVRS